MEEKRRCGYRYSPLWEDKSTDVNWCNHWEFVGGGQIRRCHPDEPRPVWCPLKEATE